MDSTPREGYEWSPTKWFISSKRAVTPVIGIILLVAIAIILAAVIGTFAFGIGDRVQDFAPNTRFTFDFNPDASGKSCGLAGGGGPDKGKLTITHDGGHNIAESQLTFVDDEGNEVGWNACSSTSVSKITSGTQATPEIDSDDTVRLIWVSENEADDTAVLATYQGPDA